MNLNIKTSAFRVFYVLFFVVQYSFAQVNGIKLGSNNNSTLIPSRGSDYRSRSGNSLNDVYAFIYIFQFGYQALTSVFQYQKSLVQTRKEDNPRILSLDLMPNLAYPVPNKSIFMLPRARANWGLFSTDFRYSHLYEFNVGKYATLDWQILQLNIVSKYNTYIRVGMGLTREIYAKRNFTEFGFNTDFKIAENTSLIFDGRYAPNFRSEIGFQVAYTLTGTEKNRTQLTAGFMYQNYFSNVHLYNAQVGLVVSVW